MPSDLPPNPHHPPVEEFSPEDRKTIAEAETIIQMLPTPDLRKAIMVMETIAPDPMNPAYLAAKRELSRRLDKKARIQIGHSGLC